MHRNIHNINDLYLLYRVYLLKYACSSVVLCFVVIMYASLHIHVIYVPIFFGVASLARRQLYDCSSSREIILKYMGKIDHVHGKQSTTKSWWCHQMKTFSALPALYEGNPLVTGGFPSHRPVTQSFDVFFDLHWKKRMSKPSRRQWFEMPSCSLWRHCNVQTMCIILEICGGSSLRNLHQFNMHDGIHGSI